MKFKLLIALLIIVFIFPLIIIFIQSITAYWEFPDLLPEKYSLRSYSYIKENLPSIFRSIGSSFLYSIITVVVTFFMCILPAKVFAREDFLYKDLLEILSLAPALVPAISFSMGVHFVFIKLGIADSMIGIIIVLSIFSYPYMLRALIAGYLAFSPDYDICAKNLGASLSTRIFKIEFPMLMPSLVSGASIVFLVAFSDYFLVFLIGGGVVPAFTSYLFPFLNSSDKDVASLLALMFLVIPILLFLIIDLTVSRSFRKKGLSS